jgi:hypothetical protein
MQNEDFAFLAMGRVDLKVEVKVKVEEKLPHKWFP